MRGFPQNAVCVVGLSKAPSQNPITFVHQSLIGSLVHPTSKRTPQYRKLWHADWP